MKIPFKVDLTGKTAIVTGGSGTLCSAMAYGLAVSGAKVAIIGRNKDKLNNVTDELINNAKTEYSKDIVVKGVVSLKRLLNQSNLKSWSSKMIKKSLEAYFFTLNNKIVFCKKQFQNMSVFCFVSTEIV